LNRSTLASSVRLRVEMPGLAVDRELALEPGEQIVFNDIVSELGLSGSGSLRVFSSEPATITSRIYNLSPDGTFGQFLGGVTGAGGLRGGDSGVLMHLKEDEVARSNIGVLNAGRRDARVEIALFDAAGAEVERFVRRIEPRRIKQFNQPFEDPGGRSDIETGYAVITVLEGEEVVAYGSVVDNGTNDPTTVPLEMGDGGELAVVAAAARGDGAEGSIWRTDLGLLNPGGSAADVTVVFHADDGAEHDETIGLEVGEHRLLDDVVGRLGGDGSGWLEIESVSPVMVSSRTYNQGVDGTLGQYLGGVAPEATVAEGARVWLPQLQQNDGFRSNIGLLNTSGEELRVKVHLHDTDGAELVTATRNLDPGERLQLQEPFDRLAGRTDIDAGYAVVEVVRGNGLVAYASVIDNATNDPTTVAMVR